jgi:hypothetical protein
VVDDAGATVVFAGDGATASLDGIDEGTVPAGLSRTGDRLVAVAPDQRKRRGEW